MNILKIFDREVFDYCVRLTLAFVCNSQSVSFRTRPIVAQKRCEIQMSVGVDLRNFKKFPIL